MHMYIDNTHLHFENVQKLSGRGRMCNIGKKEKIAGELVICGMNTM